MHDVCSNEISALKQTILKKMMRKNSCQNGAKGFTKFVTVDMPLSLNTFNKFFGHYLGLRDNLEMCPCKIQLTVQQLSIIFGQNWHIFPRKNTTTHQRFIGDISIQYRPKYSTVFDNADCPR